MPISEFDIMNSDLNAEIERITGLLINNSPKNKRDEFYSVIEECAELQKEVTKLLRGKERLHKLIEEIGDVEIMLTSLKHILKKDYNLKDLEYSIVQSKVGKVKLFTDKLFKDESFNCATKEKGEI